MSLVHYPVLLEDAIEGLHPEAGDTILDATLGGGGHAKEILDRILPGGKLLAIDRDPEAIERVRKDLNCYKDAVEFINGNFRDLDDLLGSRDVNAVDGALFDLGMSSFQVDDGKRGFSFLKEGPLDMRFDTAQELTAAVIVNKFSRDELTEIIRNYGEERHAKLVAGAICSAREKKRIETTGRLKEIIAGAIGKKYRDQRLHPAARTFQALRICTNDELASAEEGVEKAIHLLSPGARICVISFHSLEDRIVKNLFRDRKKKGELNVLTKKPIVPKEDEIKKNPRSRSAKLRVAEKTA